MERGDHLITPRTGYSHHGLYLGNQLVIHYHTDKPSLLDGEIIVSTLEAFSEGNPCHIQKHARRAYGREASVQRAYTRLGETEYNAILNNCEHFVTWCILGEARSNQVRNVATGLGTGIGTGLALSKLPAIQTTATTARTAALISGGSQLARAGVMASGLAGAGTLPVVASVAAGVAAGYVIKKAWEWLD